MASPAQRGRRPLVHPAGVGLGHGAGAVGEPLGERDGRPRHHRGHERDERVRRQAGLHGSILAHPRPAGPLQAVPDPSVRRPAPDVAGRRSAGPAAHVRAGRCRPGSLGAGRDWREQGGDHHRGASPSSASGRRQHRRPPPSVTASAAGRAGRAVRLGRSDGPSREESKHGPSGHPPPLTPTRRAPPAPPSARQPTPTCRPEPPPSRLPGRAGGHRRGRAGHRRRHPGRAGQPAQPAQAHRQRELRQPGRAAGHGQLVLRQVRRGHHRAPLLRRLRARRHRRGPRRASWPRTSSAPPTPTCSPTRASTPTWWRSGRSSPPGSRSRASTAWAPATSTT